MRRARRVFFSLAIVLLIAWLAYPSPGWAVCSFSVPVAQGGALGRPPGFILTVNPGDPVAGFWWELGMGDPALGAGNDLGSTEVAVPPASDALWITRAFGGPALSWNWTNAGTDGCISDGTTAGVMIAYLIDGGDHYVIAAVDAVSTPVLAHDFDTVITGVGPNGNDLPMVSRTDGVAPQLSSQAGDPGSGDICADVAAAIAGVNVFYDAGGPYPGVVDTSNLSLVHRIPGGGDETPLSCDPETGCTDVCWSPARELCWQGDAGAIATEVVIGGTCFGGILHGFPCDPDDPASNCVAFGGICVPELDRVFFGPALPGGCAPLSPCDGVDCDDSDACTADSCDPASGACINDDISATCDDGNVCTADSCDLAVGCINEDISTCDDGNACTADVCDPAGGACDNPDISDSCDDANACTADSCDPALGCVNQDISGSCGDGNGCTVDSCVPDPLCEGGTLHGLPCDLDDPASSCVAFGGVCVGGCVHEPLSCDDADACTADSCDPASGCLNNPISCDDGDFCTADSCDPATGCVNVDASACDDGNICTADSCDPATGACGNVDISDLCNDGNACTADSCDPASGCISVDISGSCDDGNACTVDTCVPNAICEGGGLSGFPCDPEDPADPCVAFGGVCVGGCDNQAISCDDGNICTEDSCDPASGCVHDDTCQESPAPPPVPDGIIGSPLTATGHDAIGSMIDIAWDVVSCPAAGYELLFGLMADVGSYELAGSECDLGPAGTYQWVGVPPGDLWFIMVAHDGAGKEGSWGVDGNGAPRLGTMATGACGNPARDSDGVCTVAP